jgi:hypothetical protein
MTSRPWVVLGTDYIGSYKSNNHTITPTTAPKYIGAWRLSY